MLCRVQGSLGANRTQKISIEEPRTRVFNNSRQQDFTLPARLNERTEADSDEEHNITRAKILPFASWSLEFVGNTKGILRPEKLLANAFERPHCLLPRSPWVFVERERDLILVEAPDSKAFQELSASPEMFLWKSIA